MIIGAMIVGFVGWLWKHWGKIEKNADKAATAINSDKAREIVKEELSNNTINSDRAREIVKEEIEDTKKQLSELKKDMGSMAESIKVAVEKQETRLDQLVLHLLNDRGSKK